MLYAILLNGGLHRSPELHFGIVPVYPPSTGTSIATDLKAHKTKSCKCGAEKTIWRVRMKELQEECGSVRVGNKLSY